MGLFGKLPKSNFFKKRAESLKEIIDSNEEVQEDLVRAGDSNFWHTPDEARDPNYNNPIADIPLGIESALVWDECNIGGQVNGVLAFFRLPAFQLVYRNPNCQPPPPPPNDPPRQNESFKMPAACDHGFFFRITSSNTIQEKGIMGNRSGLFQGQPYNYSYTYWGRVDNIANWAEGDEPMIYKSDLLPDFTISVSSEFELEFDSVWMDGNSYANQANADIFKAAGGTVSGAPEKAETTWKKSGKGSDKFYVRLGDGYVEPVNTSKSGVPFANGQTYGMAKMSRQEYQNVENKDYVYKSDTQSQITSYHAMFLCKKTEYKEPPPPPPKEKECDCMSCCPKIDDTLLKLILKKIGSNNLPASVPKLLTKKGAGNIQINSLAEFISYTVKQIDAVAGRYPLEIKIKDADLTQEGDQEKKITVPNISEALLEIMGMLLVLKSESSANLIATVNSMVEAGSAKQSAILAADYSRGNSEYLGYKGKQVERNVPFTFKPGEPKMDKMLVSGEVKVKGWENDDKEDLNDALAPLLELAAMWKAANFKNLGTTDTLGKLKSILTGAVELTGAVDKLVKTPPPPDPNNPNAPPPEPKKNDWDTFVEEAEQGFIAQPGITDTTHPYARPLEQRPKIREIGNDTSDEPTVTP